MKLRDFFKLRKCFCCGDNTRTVKIKDWSWSDSTTRHYHEICLHYVLAQPEQYPTKIVNVAKEIAEKIEDEAKWKKRLEDSAKALLEKQPVRLALVKALCENKTVEKGVKFRKIDI